MSINKYAIKVKKYALISFLIPLLTINTCLFLYKFIGDLNIDTYANLEISENGGILDYKIFQKKFYDLPNHKITSCSKYLQHYSFTNKKGLKINSFQETGTPWTEHGNNYHVLTLLENSSSPEMVIDKVIIRTTKIPDHRCIKNHHYLYKLFKTFGFLETIFIKTLVLNKASFVQIRNPYLYGEVSISRTARYFPATFIFKPFIILSALFLLLYWKNNLNLFNEVKKKYNLSDLSRKFFYFGVASCIFLIFHAIFLGLDIDSKIFKIMRRIIIILFIAFELTSQILLTKNIFTIKENLKNYINPFILKIKIIFIGVMFAVTFISFLYLAYGDPSTAFKNILEWNYFSILLVYYFLSRLLWK